MACLLPAFFVTISICGDYAVRLLFRSKNNHPEVLLEIARGHFAVYNRGPSPALEVSLAEVPDGSWITYTFAPVPELMPGERRTLAHAAALLDQDPDPETGDLLFARFDPRYAPRDRVLILTWSDVARRKYYARIAAGRGGLRVLKQGHYSFFNSFLRSRGNR